MGTFCCVQPTKQVKADQILDDMGSDLLCAPDAGKAGQRQNRVAHEAVSVGALPVVEPKGRTIQALRPALIVVEWVPYQRTVPRELARALCPPRVTGHNARLLHRVGTRPFEVAPTLA